MCPHRSLAKIACDFRWRSNSPRSAKIARCVRCRDCDFRRSPRSAYKIADIWRVRYRRLNSPAFAKCARSRDFLRSLLQIASKASPSGWAVLSHDFSTPPSAKKIAKCARFNRWRKSLTIFAGDQICRNRSIKSPGVSLALSVSVPAIFYGHCCESPIKLTHQAGRFYHMTFQNCHNGAVGKKNRQANKSLTIFAGDQIPRNRRIKSPGASLALSNSEGEGNDNAAKQ